jgi:Tfp pilus assembly protein PilZ
MLVAWEAGGKRTVSRVATLGLGGLYIPTKSPPAVGEVVRLVFQLPGGEVRARALVRTSEVGKGMGIAFTWMNQESRAKLNQLMKRLMQ